ncbi:MAG TPA: preprotein translocase subunit SecE, partial [Planctomycetota bacterium]|nr:preprotein translocase subunit SecE [Planctomycetota bacterium]
MPTVHKPGQGAIARRIAFGILAIVVVTAGMSFYRWLVNSNWSWLQWPKQLLTGYSSPLPLLGQKFDLGFLFSWVLVGLGLWTAYRLLAAPKRVDFLIDTEDEFRKVTWPSWREAWNASLLVLVFIGAMAIYLLLADMGLSRLLDLIL